jgi:hypothetical protein
MNENLLAIESFGWVNEWCLGGRFFVDGECKARRCNAFGYNRAFCKESAAIRYIEKDYRKYLRENGVSPKSVKRLTVSRIDEV